MNCVATGSLDTPSRQSSRPTIAMISEPLAASGVTSYRSQSVTASRTHAPAHGGSFVLSKLDDMRAPDTVTTRLFRNVWLYCGLLRLKCRSKPAGLKAWPPADRCLEALGRFASASPVPCMHLLHALLYQ